MAIFFMASSLFSCLIIALNGYAVNSIAQKYAILGINLRINLEKQPK